MKSTIVGPYPRYDSKIADELRKERGKGNVSLEGALSRALTSEIVREMLDAGIDLPHYGLTDMHDEITWPLEDVECIDLNSGQMQKIFYGHDTHFRLAIVNGEIKRKNRIMSELHDVALSVCKNVKVELTGPYTLAKHSRFDNSPYGNFRELARAYGQLLRQEILELQRKYEIPLIQFNEPSIVGHLHDNSDRNVVLDVYPAMLEGVKTKSAIWTFYGQYDNEALRLLFSLPVNAVGIDFVWDPDIRNLLKRNLHDKGIGFGIVDSCDRNEIKEQNLDDITSKIKSLEGYVDFDKSYVANNATLEHVDRQEARKRLYLISEVARRINK